MNYILEVLGMVSLYQVGFWCLIGFSVYIIFDFIIKNIHKN